MPLKPRGATNRTIPGFWRSKAGNIALITALMMIPLTFALGMAFDYTMAQSRKDQIDGIADAAALGAVTPTMLAGTPSQSQAQAQSLFNGQIANVSGVVYSSSNLSVSVGGASGATVTRTVTVSYTAASQNVFATLLGMPTFPISGTSTATAGGAPNIDFYLLLDTSPSMEIPSSQSGITTMVNETSPQGGCAFGCHETYPTADNLQNPTKITCTGESTSVYKQSGEDNYDLARCLGVTLRIDLVQQAASNLMSTAVSTAATNSAHYRAAILTTDYPGLAASESSDGLYELQSLTSTLTGANSAQSATSGIQSMEVYDNNCLTKSDCNSDQDTALDGDIECLYSGCSNYSNGLPTPGGGTNNKGDTPQEVLFIVSDGVNDYQASSGGRVINPVGSALDSKGQSWCTDIKNKGIRIAFLYTTYYPLPTNSFYVDNIEDPGYQTVNSSGTITADQFATAAEACASPGLFYKVDTGGDISAALTALFEQAVATAHLTQ